MGATIAVDVAAIAAKLAETWRFDKTALQSVHLRLIDELPSGSPGVFESQEEAGIVLADIPGFCEKFASKFCEAQGVSVNICVTLKDGHTPSGVIIQRNGRDE